MSAGARAGENPARGEMQELLAHALALEVEACERYAELATLMQTHNNLAVAALFGKMAAVEKLHVDHIRELAARHHSHETPAVQFSWLTPEGPETTDPADLHYLMTPGQALELALFNEQRARDYYSRFAGTCRDADARSLAGELAVEEEDHVNRIRGWLDTLPAGEPGWDHDDDAPRVQD